MFRLSFLILLSIAFSVSLYAQSPHGDDLKLDCSVCHNPTNWDIDFTKTKFEHKTTGFTLVGQHNVVDCKSCHTNLVFTQAEPECSTCHTDIHQETVGLDCSKCHTPKSWMVEDINGLHQISRFPLVGNHLVADCAQCHPRYPDLYFEVLDIDCYSCHKEDYNSTISPNHTEAGFSTDCMLCHSITAEVWAGASIVHDFFPLIGGHAIQDCFACHEQGGNFTGLTQECYSCHQQDYENVQDPNHLEAGFPTDCEQCHNINGWSPANLDHNQTDFPLTGAHLAVDCASCHTNGFTGTPTDCYSCHRIDDVHSGQNGTECETCHVSSSWDESTFDHALETEFALLDRHGEITCAACHKGGKFEEPLEKECVACHRQDDQHLGKNGEECGGCHDPISWIEVNYDHAEETEFPLLGAHAELECSACHKGPVYDVKLEQDCYSCHAVDDVHSGEQGQQCNDCHGEQSWTAGVKFDHDITKFPLIGLHAVVSCEACHLTEEFQKASGKCRDCHSDESSHRGRLGSNCNECHNPNGWQIWQFDHDAQTSFMLDGEHAGLDCIACHTSPVKKKIRLSKQCGVCHRVDDVHSGQFGANCGRCHTTDSFFNVGSIR